MDKSTVSWFRNLAYFASTGSSMALAVFIGLAIGLYIDKQLDSSPWFMFVFLFLGIIAGFKNLGLTIKKSRDL